MEINIKKKARFAILGAIIGDALGTSMEFMKSNDAKKIIVANNNFENGLIGKGPFNLCAGQFTDDTEMALANMSVIINLGKYDQDEVAKAYNKWFLSDPFDIGTTTRNSVSHTSAKKMVSSAKTANINSMSNGFLMRIFGLVALHYNKPAKDLIKAVKDDATLTHGHSEVHRIAIIYSTMLTMAIKGDSAYTIYNYGRYLANLTTDVTTAITDLIDHGSVQSVYSPLFSKIYHAVDNNNTKFVYNYEAYDANIMDGHNMGFVGYALWLLLFCLKNNYDYKTAMIKIAEKGGDVDTGCCIVGAVIGALHGDTIPKAWLTSVLKCNAKNRYKEYPLADPAVWTKWLP